MTARRIAAVKEMFKAVLNKKYREARFNTHAYNEHAHKPGDREGMALDRRVSILLLIQPGHGLNRQTNEVSDRLQLSPTPVVK